MELIDLAKTFDTGAGQHPAVRGVSLRIQPGEVFGVIGESGAGKSTLIRLINLLERPTSGQVLIDGEDAGALPPEGLRRLRRRVGMIFQHFNLLSSKTVAENVAFPLRLEGRLGPEAIKARVAQLLGRVGLTSHAGAYPAKLSGGQKQRVGIARALACEPTVLLCDEATSALDPETTRQVLELLAELNRELGLTVVLITHEMDVVRQVCDRVAVLEAGRVVESGDVVDVFLNAEHPVTRRMLGQDDEPPVAGMGRKVRLTYRGKAAHAPFLSRIAKETGVDFSLHSGRVAQIKGEPYGQLTLSLDGAQVDEALARFAAAGIRVQELTA
ncbi:MAG TPA: ATP-binding cassette domain-containing protein [Caulobacteraceae bacterium]